MFEEPCFRKLFYCFTIFSLIYNSLELEEEDEEENIGQKDKKKPPKKPKEWREVSLRFLYCQSILILDDFLPVHLLYWKFLFSFPIKLSLSLIIALSFSHSLTLQSDIQRKLR